MKRYFVTVLTGDKYGDIYLQRLYNMVARHAPGPFSFTAFTDRARHVSPEINQVDCASWGLKGWFNKMRLLDQAILPEPFVYFDVTLVIKSPLQPLIEAIEGLDRDLCSRQDFRYDEINSCVLGVRPGALTQAIWDAFVQMAHPEDATKGDQTFIYRTLQRQGRLADLGLIDPSLILSYRHLRRLAMKSPEEAATQLARAVVLKFHGEPRMPDTQDPWRSWLLAIGKDPLHARKMSRYLRGEIADWWS